jgi:hypothetical protein
MFPIPPQQKRTVNLLEEKGRPETVTVRCPHCGKDNTVEVKRR